MSVSGRQKLTRRGKKLTSQTDNILASLPKDIPEQLWTEVMTKEEQDLFILDIREEILEKALDDAQQSQMDRQCISFTVNCFTKALIRLADLHFYKIDPGTEAIRANTKTTITNIPTSWIEDTMPPPSPKDTWAKVALPVRETKAEVLPRWPSADSLDLPEIEEIPIECRFPGRIRFPGQTPSNENSSTEETLSKDSVADIEVLEKVTDYGSSVTASADQQTSTPSSTGYSLLDCHCESETETETGSPQKQVNVVDSLQNVESLRKRKRDHSIGSDFSRLSGRLAPLKLPPHFTKKGSMESLFTDVKPRHLCVETHLEIGEEIAGQEQQTSTSKKRDGVQ